MSFKHIKHSSMQAFKQICHLYQIFKEQQKSALRINTISTISIDRINSSLCSDLYQTLFEGGGQSQEDRRLEERLDELKRDKARSDERIQQIQGNHYL